MISRFTNRTSARTPSGVAWPTVSARQRRRAPQRSRCRTARLQRLGVGARRVLGHEHHRQPLLTAKRDRLLGRAQQVVQRPVLGVLPDRRRADERRASIGDPDLLGDRARRARRRPTRARGAVGGERELRVARSPARARACRHHARAGAGQPDVGAGDAEVDHEVQQLLLALDVGIRHRRGLQAVAQRLVVQLDAAALQSKPPGAAFQSWIRSRSSMGENVCRFTPAATPREPRRGRQRSPLREH